MVDSIEIRAEFPSMEYDAENDSDEHFINFYRFLEKADIMYTEAVFSLMRLGRKKFKFINNPNGCQLFYEQGGEYNELHCGYLSCD